MTFELSSGSLHRLLNATQGDDDMWESGHVIQILSLKKIAGARDGQGPDRYRLIVSDGSHYTQAMLATQLSRMVDEQLLNKNTIIKVQKLTCNNVKNKRLLIFLDITVLGESEEKIGKPEALDMPGGPAVAATLTAPENGIPTPAPAVNTSNYHQQKQLPKPAIQPKGPQGHASGPTIYPIEGLSPYQNKWTIKARVTQKSEIRHYATAKGEGKLFNVTLMDDSGEIRATGFNEAVDMFHDKLEEGKVYFVSKARVQLAKKKFSNLQNEYELSLDHKTTEIMECPDQTNAPQVKYNFVQLSDLESQQKDSTCDVIGVVKEVAEISEITSKATNKQIKKRELTLVDRSEFSVRLTLWGKQAESYNAEENIVIAFKGVKVGDFGGRSLSMVSSSSMSINPDITDCHVLRGWFDAAGSGQKFKSHTNSTMGSGPGGAFNRNEIRTLADVKDSQIGMGDQPEYFSCRATIVHIKSDNLSYPACPSEGCNKKVTQDGEGWRCEKCDRSWSQPEHRYIMSMSVADYTGQAWLQGFNDVGNAVFGMPANQLNELRENNETEYTAVLAKANCNTFNFSCRAKQDTYNETTRVRYGITKIMPLDFKVEAGHLRDVLKGDWAK